MAEFFPRHEQFDPASDPISADARGLETLQKLEEGKKLRGTGDSLLDDKLAVDEIRLSKNLANYRSYKEARGEQLFSFRPEVTARMEAVSEEELARKSVKLLQSDETAFRSILEENGDTKEFDMRQSFMGEEDITYLQEAYSLNRLLSQSGYSSRQIKSGAAEQDMRGRLSAKEDGTETTRAAYLRWGLSKTNEYDRRREASNETDKAVFKNLLGLKDPYAGVNEMLDQDYANLANSDRTQLRLRAVKAAEAFKKSGTGKRVRLLRRVFNTIADQESISTDFDSDEDKPFDSMEDAVAAMSKVPKKHWEEMSGLMAKIAQESGQDVDYVMRTIEGRKSTSAGRKISRAATDLVESSGEANMLKNIKGAKERLNKLVLKDIYVPKNVKEGSKAVAAHFMIHGASTKKDLGVVEGFIASIADAVLPGEQVSERRLVTDEERIGLVSEFQSAENKVFLGSTLRNWRDSVAKIEGDNWFTENFVYGLAGSVPEMVATGTGAGLSLVINAQTGRNMMEVKRRFPEAEWEKQMAPATHAAVLYGLLGVAQLGTITRKLPATKGIVLDMLKRTGIEAVQETGQDLAFAHTMEMYGAINSDIKDFQMLPTVDAKFFDEGWAGKTIKSDGELLSAIKRFPKTMLAVAPLTIMGVGGRKALNYFDVKEVKGILANKELMTLYGFDESIITEVRKMPVEQALDFIQQHHSETIQNMKEFEVAPSETDVRIIPQENNTFTITDGQGTSLEAKSPEEAAQAAQQLDPDFTENNTPAAPVAAPAATPEQATTDPEFSAEFDTQNDNELDPTDTPVQDVEAGTVFEMSLLPGFKAPGTFEAGENKGRSKAGLPPLVDKNTQRRTMRARARYKLNTIFSGRMIGTKALNQISEQAKTELEAIDSTFSDLANAVNRAVKKAAKDEPRALIAARETKIREDSFLALHGDDNAMKRLPEPVRKHIESARSNIDFVTKQLIDTGILDKDLVEKLGDNIGKYVFREYRAFQTDSGWTYEYVKKNEEAIYQEALDYIATDRKITHADADNIIREMLDPENSNGGDFLLGGSMVGKVDVTSFIKKKELDNRILNLLGEIRDPATNIKNTGSKGAGMLTAYKMQAAMADVLLQMKLASKTVNESKRFFKKNFVGRELVPYTNVDPVTGEVKSGTVEKVSSRLKGFGKLYVEPEVLAELEAYFAPQNGKPDIIGTLAGMLAKVVTVGKFNQVVLSPQAYGTNLLGGLAFEVAAGRVTALNSDGAKAYAKILTKDTALHKRENPYTFEEQVKVHNMTIAEHGDSSNMTMEQLEGELRRAGLLNNSVFAGDVIATTELGYGKDGKLARVAKKASAAYQASDNAAKASAFIHEVNKWKKALPAINPKTKKPTTMREVFDRAGRDTRMTTQNYDMVPALLKKLSQTGIIAPSYVSFTVEMIRNTANNVILAKEEIASGNPTLVWSGTKRVIGMAVLGGLMHSLSTWIQEWMSGFDDEEREKLRATLAPWNKYSSMVFTGRNEKGHLGFFDPSYIIPQFYFYNAAAMAMRPGDADVKGYRAFKAISQPFEDKNILTQMVIDVFSGHAENGKPIYNELTDDSFDKAFKSGGHVLENMFTPGILRSFNNWNKAQKGEVGYAGDVTSTDDIMTSMFGVRQRHLDPDSEEFIAGNLSSYNWDSREINKAVTKNKLSKLSQEKQDRELQKVEVAQALLLKDFKASIRMFKTLGVSNDRIKKGVHEATVPKFLKMELPKLLKD